MKLSANVISKGKYYYKAGEDIPEDLLSPVLRKYAVSGDEEVSTGTTDPEEPKVKVKLGL